MSGERWVDLLRSRTRHGEEERLNVRNARQWCGQFVGRTHQSGREIKRSESDTRFKTLKGCVNPAALNCALSMHQDPVSHLVRESILGYYIECVLAGIFESISHSEEPSNPCSTLCSCLRGRHAEKPSRDGDVDEGPGAALCECGKLGKRGWGVCMRMACLPVILPIRACFQRSTILDFYLVDSALPQVGLASMCPVRTCIYNR